MTAVIEAASAGVKDMADGSLFARLERRVAIDADGCWKFIGCTTPRGYGAIQLNGRKVGAHRAMWQSVNGVIPHGMLVCHRCDVRDCINPDHLFLGTSLDNNRDRAQKGRSHRPVGELNVMAKVSDENRAAAVAEFLAGKSASDIAKGLGVSQGSIHLWIRNTGQKITRPRSGERNGRAKLDRKKVEEIKKLLADGKSQMAIGRQFNVSGQAIWLIANKRAWS